MQSMSQTSHSPNAVSFFAKFIPSEILPEIMFCHVEISYLLKYRNYGAKLRNSRNKFFTLNWYVRSARFNFRQILSKLSTQCS